MGTQIPVKNLQKVVEQNQAQTEAAKPSQPAGTISPQTTSTGEVAVKLDQVLAQAANNLPKAVILDPAQQTTQPEQKQASQEQQVETVPQETQPLPVFEERPASRVEFTRVLNTRPCANCGNAADVIAKRFDANVCNTTKPLCGRCLNVMVANDGKPLAWVSY